MSVLVKICGLNTADTVDAAVRAGADMVGFNSFAKSPRYVAPDRAGDLGARVPERIAKVGVFVDPDDDMLAAFLDRATLDMIQLHGRETPARVAAVRARFGLPVIKAMGIATPDDLSAAVAFNGAANRLLLDAKPPKGADRPGGNAQAFDWTILAEWRAPLPWLLSGGLNPDNVAEAVAISRAPGVDVASGVESASGVKDIAVIAAFIAAAKSSLTPETGIPGLIL